MVKKDLINSRIFELVLASVVWTTALILKRCLTSIWGLPKAVTLIAAKPSLEELAVIYIKKN